MQWFRCSTTAAVHGRDGPHGGVDRRRGARISTSSVGRVVDCLLPTSEFHEPRRFEAYLGVAAEKKHGEDRRDCMGD